MDHSTHANAMGRSTRCGHRARRKEQQERIVRGRDETKSLVIDGSLRVERIHKQTNCASLLVDSTCPRQCIHQQQLTEAPALHRKVNRQASQAHAWHSARQLLAPHVGKVSGVEFSNRQCEIAANPVRRLLADRDKCLRQAFVLVLARYLSQPVVQLQPPAVEPLAVMAPIQSDYLHHRSLLSGSASLPSSGPRWAWAGSR